MRACFSFCIPGAVAAAIALAIMTTGSAAAGERAAGIRQQWNTDSHFDRTHEADNTLWWRNFNDATLDTLIALGSERNYNLAIAARRIAIARNNLAVARSAFFPSLTLNAGWSRNRNSGAMTTPATDASVVQGWHGSVAMNWEIDLFGKISAQAGRSKALVNVSAAEYAAAMVALEADIAGTFINLRISQAQMELARSHSEKQAQVVKITEARHESGIASRLDVTQARTVYYSTIASIPLLESSINSSINALSVLLGMEPDSLPATVKAGGTVPDCHMLVATGVPLDLLERRPDIVAARASVDAAAAALGIARKDYLPDLAIGGSIGTEAHSAKNLFTGRSFTYTVSPTLSWTIFDGLSRRNNIQSAQRELENETDNYHLAVLTAIEEADNAMNSYVSSLHYISSLQKVVEESEMSLDLSLALYKPGLSPFSNVVDAQLNVLEYQNTLISAQGRALSSLIDLFKALGGGWDGNL